MGEPAILFFDGVCNLCNATVDFLMRRDPAARLRFAPLQGEAARRLLAGRVAPAEETGIPDGVVLWRDGEISFRSTAALRALALLGGGWRPAAGLLLLVPRPLRDAVYAVVARRRYGWFGRRPTCRVPSPEEAARFLD